MVSTRFCWKTNGFQWFPQSFVVKHMVFSGFDKVSTYFQWSYKGFQWLCIYNDWFPQVSAILCAKTIVCIWNFGVKPLSVFANAAKSHCLCSGFPCAAIVCIVQFCTWGFQAQNPSSRLRDPSCTIRVLDHTPRAACSNIQAPDFKFQALGSRLQAAGSKFQAPSSQVQLSTFTIYAPTSSVQSPRLQLQGSGTKLNATSIGLLLIFSRRATTKGKTSDAIP